MANGPEIKMELETRGSIRRNFEELPKRAREKSLKKSATAGGTVLTRAVRRLVPVESGLTKKSVTKKVKLYKQSETAAAIIGADADAEGEYRGNVRKPAKYFAIIDEGAKAHNYVKRKGSHPGFAGKHFMEKAEASSGASALEAAQEKLAEVIEAEAEKLD